MHHWPEKYSVFISQHILWECCCGTQHLSRSWTWPWDVTSPLGGRPSKRNPLPFCSWELRSQTYFLVIHTQTDSHTAALWRHHTTRPVGRRQPLFAEPDAPSQNHKGQFWRSTALTGSTPDSLLSNQDIPLIIRRFHIQSTSIPAPGQK